MDDYYMKEEEFLDKFRFAASAASDILAGDWTPNYHCNDRVRRNQEYFLSTGELRQLTFDSAAVHHDSHGFSYVDIVLRSSVRIVTVRVKEENGKLVAEKIVDRVVDS